MATVVETRVARIQAPREVRFERETLVLEGLSQREVAAETLYSAISPGSELAVYHGLAPLRADRKFSSVVGHCNLAQVVAVGEWVRRYRPGDLILTLESHRSHFICGVEDVLLKLPEREYTQQQLAEVSTTYLFHQAYGALLRGNLKPGQYVAVVGLGTLGQATVAVASRFGARVFGFSGRSSARARATEFGARGVFEKGHDKALRSALGEATSGTGIDIVVLAADGWDDWRLALELVRPGGSVCVLAFPGRQEPIPPFNPLDPILFYRKQLDLIACGYTPDVEVDARDIRFTIRRNSAYLLDLIVAGDLPARQLVSAIEPWHCLGAVYERMSARQDGFLTAVLQWTGEPNDD